MILTAIGVVRTLWRFFSSPTGKIIGAALIALAVLGYVYVKGQNDGAARIQRKWDTAVEAAAEQARNARSTAERDNAPLEPAPAPVVPSTCPAPADLAPRARNDGVLRSDPANRERGRK